MDDLLPHENPCRTRSAGGAAWSACAIGLVTSVPTIASSGSGSVTVLGRGSDEVRQAVSVPSGTTITYTLWGGGGAGNPATPNYQGGSGAQLTGTFTLGTCHSADGQTALTLIAAGGGGATAGGGGYGPGGDPGHPSTHSPTGGRLTGRFQGSGGGGGSAILRDCGTHGWRPVVVAGGGGGGGGGFIYHESSGQESPWRASSSVIGGYGGSAPEGPGTGTIITLVNGETMSVPGAPGGVRATPGAGGSGGSTTLTSTGPATQTCDGRPGSGPSSRCGGHGAAGITATLEYPPDEGMKGLWESIGSAGGGGGYAGGGSSGLTLSSLRAAEGHLIAGASAGGGAGSNFVHPGDKCVTVNSATTSRAGNGGIGTVGGVGLVTVSWS